MINNITDHQIYILRKEGYTYLEIARFYCNAGIEITRQAICARYLKYCKEHEITIQNDKKEINQEIRKQIFEMKHDEEFTYQEIYDRLLETNVKHISKTAIVQVCNEEYEKRGLGKPTRSGKSSRKKGIDPEEVFRLKEAGKTNVEIAEYYTNEKNTPVNYNTIRSFSQRVYKSKGLPERINRGCGASNEEIYRLRKQGMTFNEIAEYFRMQGIQTSSNSLCVRYLNIVKKLNKEATPNIDIRVVSAKKFQNALINLFNTRNATENQLQKLANYYGFTYNPQPELKYNINTDFKEYLEER